MSGSEGLNIAHARCVCVRVSMCPRIWPTSSCNGPLLIRRILWAAAKRGVGKNVLVLATFFLFPCKLRNGGALNFSKGENAPLEGTKQSLCLLVHMCGEKTKQRPHYNCIRGCILRWYKEAEKVLKAPANFFFQMIWNLGPAIAYYESKKYIQKHGISKERGTHAVLARFPHFLQGKQNALQSWRRCRLRQFDRRATWCVAHKQKCLVYFQKKLLRHASLRKQQQLKSDLSEKIKSYWKYRWINYCFFFLI